jgi:outer membrane protein
MEMYRMALQNDPRLAAARFEHEASQQSSRAALAGLLPSVIGTGEKTRERQNIISSQTAVIGPGVSTFPIEAWGLTITQPLFKLDSWERMKQAEASERQALALRIASEQALMVRVANAYVGVLAASDALEFASAERTAVEKQFQLAKERLVRGLATVVNLHDAQARFSQTEAQEIEAQATLDDARRAMSEILGTLPASFPPLREEIPTALPSPASVEQWVETAVRQNPGLRAKRFAADVAEGEMKKQRAGYAPTLNLVGRYNNRDQGGTLFGGGSHVETSDISLMLNLPFYEGGSTTALTEEASLRYRKSLQESEAEMRAVDRQTRAAYLGVVSAATRVKALEQGVLSQKSALQAKEESYRSGILTLIAVLDAERDLYFARRDYAKARYDYLLNGLKLKQSTGSLSDTDLEAVDALLKR